jgi:hypothetical protein
MRLCPHNNFSVKLPLDPADRYYETLVYRRLSKTDSVFLHWLSRFLLHFAKGMCMGTGMFWTMHALKVHVGTNAQ